MNAKLFAVLPYAASAAFILWGGRAIWRKQITLPSWRLSGYELDGKAAVIAGVSLIIGGVLLLVAR
jgi:hypothetical protein